MCGGGGGGTVLRFSYTESCPFQWIIAAWVDGSARVDTSPERHKWRITTRPTAGLCGGGQTFFPGKA